MPNKHLHITLVGGQKEPVYQGIVYDNPEYVIFITSDQTKGDAELIAKATSVPYELITLSPVDIKEVEAVLSSLKTLVNNYEKITLNITSGTKIWSILFFNYFKNIEKAKIIYIDQNNNVWDLKEKKCFDHEFIKSIHDFLNRFGNNFKNFRRISDFDSNDIDAVKKIEELRKFEFNEFNKLTQWLLKYTDTNEYSTKRGSIIRYESKEKNFYLKLIKNNGTTKELSLKSPNIRYLLLNTGWFELKVAQILSKWELAKEIILNCEFQTKEGAPKNEVDIIVNTGKKLLFVECKTQIFSTTDIDKFASVIRNFGGLGAKGIFITEAKLNKNALEKCNDNKLLSFSLNESNYIQNPEKMLYIKLESEWLNLNPK